MLEWLEWWPALFGWPAIIVSMGLAATGIKLRKPVLLVVSAVLVAPLSLYLSGAASWFALTGPVILFSLLASAYAVKRALPESQRRFTKAESLKAGVPVRRCPGGGRLA